MTYRACLKKRAGRITAPEFLEQARRLVAVCDEVYEGCSLELVRDQHVSLTGLFRVDFDLDPWAKGAKLDKACLDDSAAFARKFNGAYSMRMSVSPEREADFNPSFAQIRWEARRPRELSFYGQDASNKNLASLTRALGNQLFVGRSIGSVFKYSLHSGLRL